MKSSLLLNAQLKVDDKHIEYEKEYFYDELIKNKYLNICDSINEIYEQLNLEFKKNKFNIKEEDNILQIIIPLEGFIKNK